MFPFCGTPGYRINLRNARWPRNRTGTGTVRTVFPGTERGTGTAGTVFQEPKPEPEPFSLLKCTETHKTPSFEEPPEPKTGTARTVPSPNRNRTEPGPPWKCPFYTVEHRENTKIFI